MRGRRRKYASLDLTSYGLSAAFHPGWSRNATVGLRLFVNQRIKAPATERPLRARSGGPVRLTRRLPGGSDATRPSISASRDAGGGVNKGMQPGRAQIDEAELRAHTLWLRRLAVRLVRGDGQADDAVQETMLTVLRHRPALDRDVRPWLARVLMNLVRSARRADRRRRGREAAMTADGERPLAADELLERHAAARVVATMVSELGEPHRTLVLLRYSEGLPTAEIARQRGVPEGTVRRQLSEAVDRLRTAVAAHYGRQARDWRAALVPLVGAGSGTARRAAPWTGAMLMTAKTKLTVGLGAAAVLLIFAGVGGRRGADSSPTRRTESAAPHPAPALRSPASDPRGRAPAPIFAAATPALDPPDCASKLAATRAQASRRALLSSSAFASANPSPATERAFAPIVERVMKSLPGPAAHQLECRASICRVGVVSEPGDTRDRTSWFRALHEEPAFAALRGSNQGARLEATTTRDALTGAPVQHHWLYFSVPLAPGEEHPLEASAPGATCGERLRALEQAMYEDRDADLRGDEAQQRLRDRFGALPPNVALTRRVEAALRSLTSGDGGAAVGTSVCRGDGECIWTGPARALEGRLPEALADALATQGLVAGQVRAHAREAADGGATELMLRLHEKNAAPPASPERTSRVEIRRVSRERITD